MTDARTAELEALWLNALQQVVGRAAHEIKGALNGVCVNLEVVRSRTSTQTGTLASGVARFAEAAAGQLDALVAMNDALLAVTRRPREVVDVASTARQLVTLLAPVARTDGRSLKIVEEGSSGGAMTSAPGAAVRLVLATVLLYALDRRAATTCRVDAADGMVIRVECALDGTIDLDPRVARAAEDAGIRIETDDAGLSLTFPRAGRSSARHAATTRERA